MKDVATTALVIVVSAGGFLLLAIAADIYEKVCEIHAVICKKEK